MTGHLFVDEPFTAHSGAALPFKIECDALTPADLATLAQIVARDMAYGEVYGIARGGIGFAAALARARKHIGPLVLIADDVLTTGASMEEARLLYPDRPVRGVVIFARGPCPDWVTPLFTLNRAWGLPR